MRTLSKPDDTSVDLPPVTDPPPPIPDSVLHWRGDATGSWWAVLPARDGWHLVESATLDHLAVTVAWHLRTAAW